MRFSLVTTTAVALLFFAGQAYAAVVTWTGLNNNAHFGDALNWDLKAVPVDGDHINIGNGAVVQLTSDTMVGSLHLTDGANLVVEKGLRFGTGLNIDRTATLTLLGGSLSTNTQPTLAAPNPANPAPAKVFPTITVAGTLALSGGQISGAPPAAPLSTAAEPTVILEVAEGGAVTVSGDTATRFQRTRAHVSGTFTILSTRPLELAFAHIQVRPSGLLSVAGAGAAAALSKADAVAATGVEDTTSRIEVQGRFTSDASNLAPEHGTQTVTQVYSVPLEGTAGSGMEFKAGPDRTGFFRIENKLVSDGAVALSPNAQLVLAGENHVFTSVGALSVPNGAAVYVENGVTRFMGGINTPSSPEGSIVLRHTASIAGAAHVAELFLLGGGLLLGAPEASARAHDAEVNVAAQLYWEGGDVAAAGSGPVRRIVVGPAATATVAPNAGTAGPGAPRTLEGAVLSLGSSTAKIVSGTTFALGDGGLVEVQPSAMLTVEAGATVSDASAAGTAAIVALPGGVVHADLVKGAGKPAVIAVPIRGSDATAGAGAGAALLLTGAPKQGERAMGQQHELVLKRTSAFSEIVVTPEGAEVLLTIDGTAAPSRPVIVLPATLAGVAGLSLAVHGADASLPPGSAVTAASLSVADGGKVTLGTGADLTLTNALVLGSGALPATSAAAAEVMGDATVRAHAVVLVAGTLKPTTLLVGAGGMDVRKDIDHPAVTTMTTLQATPSSSTITPAAAATGAAGSGGAAMRAVGSTAVRFDSGSSLTVAANTDVDVTSVSAVWHLQPGSAAALAPGARLRAPQPRSTSGGVITPQLWLEQATLSFPTGTEPAKAAAQVAMHVRNSGGTIIVRPGTSGVLAGGLTSEDKYGSPATDSRIALVGADSTLTVGAAQGVPSTTGLAAGPGALVLAGGSHRVAANPLTGWVRVGDGAEAQLVGGAATEAGVALSATDNFAIIPGLNDGAVPPAGAAAGTAPGGAAAGAAPGTAGVMGPGGATLGSADGTAGGAHSGVGADMTCPRQRVMGSDASNVAWGLLGSTIFLGLAALGLGGGMIAMDRKHRQEKQQMQRGMAQPSVLMGGLARNAEGLASPNAGHPDARV